MQRSGLTNDSIVTVGAPLRAQRGEGTGEGSAPPVVQVTHLAKSFPGPSGPIEAVADLSLAVRPGEVLAVVGPSGCGKSTLLRILAGLERPTAGAVRVERGDRRLATATVFQGVSLFPWATVEQNVAYPLRIGGSGRRARRAAAREALALVGLTSFARAYPAQLSEGMRQRVAIARALVGDAAVLLLDEPFSALDEPTRLLLQDELQQILLRGGQTAILVTHSIDEAVRLGDRVHVLSARPARIRAEFAVPFDRPRRYDAVKTDPRFGALTVAIWDVLREEVERAGGVLGGGARTPDGEASP